MNTGHPISSAYLILGILLALAVAFTVAVALAMMFRGPAPLPLDPVLPIPAVRS